MRIIDHDDVGAETGDRRKRHRPAIAAGEIVELRNLRVVEPNPVAPPPLIPVRFDEPATGETMLVRQPLDVGEVGELDARSHHCAGPHRKPVPLIVGIWILRPGPGREEHVDAARLHVPRRHGKDERTRSFDLAPRHRHQMVGHTVDVPVRLEVLWFPGMVPRRLDEITEQIFITDHVDALASCKRGQVHALGANLLLPICFSWVIEEH